MKTGLMSFLFNTNFLSLTLPNIVNSSLGRLVYGKGGGRGREEIRNWKREKKSINRTIRNVGGTRSRSPDVSHVHAVIIDDVRCTTSSLRVFRTHSENSPYVTHESACRPVTVEFRRAYAAALPKRRTIVVIVMYRVCTTKLCGTLLLYGDRTQYGRVLHWPPRRRGP